MNTTSREFQHCVRRDCEAAPLPNLKAISKRLGFVVRGRLPNATAVLLERPGDTAAAVLFLRELFTWTKRQIGGGVAIGPTFVQTVSELGEDVLAALPPHTRAALARLAERVAQEPIEITAFDQPAGALTREDGHLLAWLGTDPKVPQPKPASPRQVFRKLANKYHPDRTGGDAEVMSDLNELMRAVKQSA